MKSSYRMVKEKTKNFSLSSRIQELFYLKKNANNSNKPKTSHNFRNHF